MAVSQRKFLFLESAGIIVWRSESRTLTKDKFNFIHQTGNGFIRKNGILFEAKVTIEGNIISF